MVLRGIKVKNESTFIDADIFHKPVIWCSYKVQNLSKLSKPSSCLDLAKKVAIVVQAVLAAALFIPSVVLGLVGDLFLSTKVRVDSLDFHRASTVRLLRNVAQELLTDLYRTIKYKDDQIDIELGRHSGMGKWLDAARSFNKLGYIRIDAIASYGQFLQKEFSQIAFFDTFLREDPIDLERLFSKKCAIEQGKTLLAFPVAVAGMLVNHAVIIVVDIANDKIEFYDSKGFSSIDRSQEMMRNGEAYNISELILELKRLYLSPEARLVENIHKHQDDGFNCAVYSCDYLWRRLNGEPAEAIFEKGRDFSQIVSSVRPRIIQQILKTASDEDLRLLHQMWEEIVQQNGLALESAPDEITNDPKIAWTAFLQNFASLRFVSDSLKENREFIAKACLQNGRAFSFAAENLRNDPILAMVSIEQNVAAIESLGPHLRIDRQFILKAVQKNGLALKFLSAEFRNDPEIALAAIQENVEAVEFLGEDLQRDHDFFLTVVSHNGLALKWASKNFQNNEEIAFTAMEQNVYALQFLGESLRSNREFFLRMVEKNGLAIEFADLKFKGDLELLQKAMRQNIAALGFAPGSIYKDKASMTTLIHIDGRALKYAGIFRGDPEFVQMAVEQNGRALQYADKYLTKDARIANAALRQTLEAFEFVDITLQNDRAFILELARSKPEIIGLLDPELRSSGRFMLKVAKANTKGAFFAHESLKKNPHYGRSLVEEKGLALEFLSEELKDDVNIVKAAIFQNKKAFVFASKRLKQMPEIRALIV